MPTSKIVVIAVLAVLLGAALYFYGQGGSQPSTPPPSAETEEWRTYEKFGVSFRYPEKYFLVERDLGSPQRRRHSLTIMEDTRENRDLVAGVNTVPREGPPAVSLDLFQNNLDGMTAENFVTGTNYSNYKLSSDGELRNVSLGGEPALSYRWDGLYAGESVVVARPDWVHMWSVTYLDPEDELRRDFERILATVRFQ